MAVVGLLHPGSMGAAMGAALRANGHTVLWASAGRSDETRVRAHAEGLTDAGDLVAVARQAEVVISICPPEHALTVANEGRTAGFGGIFVDANAVSPQTALEIAPSVDGGVIGGPPRTAGTTRLYLSGVDAK